MKVRTLALFTACLMFLTTVGCDYADDQESVSVEKTTATEITSYTHSTETEIEKPDTEDVDTASDMSDETMSKDTDSESESAKPDTEGGENSSIESDELTWNETDGETESDESAETPERVDVKAYLAELLSGYAFDPYSFIPETMLRDYEARIVSKNDIVDDYSNFVDVSRIAKQGMGEQWNLVLDNLLQSQIFFNVLSVVDTVATTSVVAFNNYIDTNPDATAKYVFQEGIYAVTINCDADNICYVLDYTLEDDTSAEQAVQIAISMDISDKTKTVRIQIGDANALKYTVADDSYSFALKMIGLKRSYFEIMRNEDGTVKGSIYEFWQVADDGNSIELQSAVAEFYITDDYVTAVGNKADGMLAFKGYICELYNAKSGEMLAYEVKETLSFIEYNTLWFDLRNINGISSVRYSPKMEDSEAMFFVNGLSKAWKSDTVGAVGGVKYKSRRFDIEFRKQYYYCYDSESNEYKSIAVDVPMLFVQEEVYDDLVKDVKDKNNIDISVSLKDLDVEKLMNDYARTIPVLIENLDNISADDIVEIIGEKTVLY